MQQDVIVGRRKVMKCRALKIHKCIPQVKITINLYMKIILVPNPGRCDVTHKHHKYHQSLLLYNKAPINHSR